MKKSMTICLLHFLILCSWWLILSGCSESPSGPTYDQTGYYKGENKSRVYSYQIPENTTKTEIKEHGSRLSWTEGRVTSACYWHNPPHESKDLLTLSPNMETALLRGCGERSGGHKPAYQFWRSPAGQQSVNIP